MSSVLSGRVRLNVGGTPFETTVETLCRLKGTMLETMVSKRWNDGPLVDGDVIPEFFIDRDPTHFRHILNYLRDGTPIVPRNSTEARELEAEVKFYGIYVNFEMPSVVNGRVRLNVGGTVFETTLETLRRVNGTMLERMVSERWNDGGPANGDMIPELFIDHDPSHFGIFLNHLRDGTPIVPRNKVDEGALEAEAKFYGIDLGGPKKFPWFRVGEKVDLLPNAAGLYEMRQDDFFGNRWFCNGCQQEIDYCHANCARRCLSSQSGTIDSIVGARCVNVSCGGRILHVFCGRLKIVREY